jgi:pyruvate/2-oxoglutarate dehydrogenase complex dihydrolipoamide dehydrogenase (E3) component
LAGDDVFDVIVIGAGPVGETAARRANSDNIGLRTVGLKDGGPVEVDATMRARGVEGGWLYAVGDVNGRNLLTHMGKYQARICAGAIVAHAEGVAEDSTALRDLAGGLGAAAFGFDSPMSAPPQGAQP